MPSPLETPELYETIFLGGQALPGIAEVSSASRPFKWDSKIAKGSSGATVTYQGEDLAKPKVKLKLWLPEHFEALPAAMVMLKRPQNAKNPTALDVQHPYLDELDVRSVVIEDVGQLTHAGKGLFTLEIQLLEYRPPKKAGGTPKGSKSTSATGGSGYYQAPAKTAAEQELEALLEKAKAA